MISLSQNWHHLKPKEVVHVVNSQSMKLRTLCGLSPAGSVRHIRFYTFLDRKDFYGREFIPGHTCLNCARVAGWIAP